MMPQVLSLHRPKAMNLAYPYAEWQIQIIQDTIIRTTAARLLKPVLKRTGKSIHTKLWRQSSRTPDMLIPADRAPRLTEIQAPPYVAVNLNMPCRPTEKPNIMSDTARLASNVQVLSCKDFDFFSATRTAELPLIINTHAQSLIELTMISRWSIIADYKTFLYNQRSS